MGSELGWHIAASTLAKYIMSQHQTSVKAESGATPVVSKCSTIKARQRIRVCHCSLVESNEVEEVPLFVHHIAVARKTRRALLLVSHCAVSSTSRTNHHFLQSLVPFQTLYYLVIVVKSTGSLSWLLNHNMTTCVLG